MLTASWRTLRDSEASAGCGYLSASLSVAQEAWWGRYLSCNGCIDTQLPMGADTAEKNKETENPTYTLFSESRPQDQQ